MLAIYFARVGPSKPVVWLVATILAPTTAAPEGSTMVPVIVAVSTCAKTGKPGSKSMPIRSAARDATISIGAPLFRRFIVRMILHLPSTCAKLIYVDLCFLLTILALGE